MYNFCWFKYYLTKALSVLILLLTLSNVASAQLDSFEDLQKTTEKGFFKTYFVDAFKGFTQIDQPLQATGNIGIKMRSYNTYNGALRQDPFFYTLNSSLNFKVFRFNVPFSFLLTAKNQQSSLPNFEEIKQSFKVDVIAQKNRFLRFGFSPHYKWMKFHLGHRSMNFSQFTLANLNFFGVGTELNPGKTRLTLIWLYRSRSGSREIFRPFFYSKRNIFFGSKVLSTRMSISFKSCKSEV